jgi:hypothetical protein
MDAVSRVRKLPEVVSTETLVHLPLVKQLSGWGVPARSCAPSLRVAEGEA